MVLNPKIQRFLVKIFFIIHLEHGFFSANQTKWVCLDMWNTPKDKKYGSLFHYNSLYLFLDKTML